MACAGNSTELCGGPNALNVGVIFICCTVTRPHGDPYRSTTSQALSPVPLVFLSAAEVEAVLDQFSSTPLPPASPATGHTPLAMCEQLRFSYGRLQRLIGTSDNANGRIMANQNPDDQGLTVESCVASCTSQNFTLAGLEFGVQCCEYT